MRKTKEGSEDRVRLNIAIFTNTFLPTMNGVAVSTANLREALRAAGHEVFIFSPAPAGYDCSQDDEGVIRYLSVRHPRIDYPIALPIKSWSRGAKPVALPKFDLVHTQHFVWAGEWGRRYAAHHNLAVVSTAHTQNKLYSGFVPFVPRSAVDRFIDWRLPRYYNRCSLVTTPAGSSKLMLIDAGVKTDIVVVPNSIDATSIGMADGAAVRKKYGCTQDDVLLSYVGRLSHEKNLDVLMDAVSELMPGQPNLRLLIVGDGECQTHLEERARAICEQRIFFAGRVSQSEVPAHASAANVFIAPSISEIQPVSFAEQMAAGTPVVVADAPGGKDMVRDGYNGRLVNPDEGGAGFARAIMELVSNPQELARMGARAKEWALSHYDKPVIAERMVEEVYLPAIRNHRRSR